MWHGHGAEDSVAVYHGYKAVFPGVHKRVDAEPNPRVLDQHLPVVFVQNVTNHVGVSDARSFADRISSSQIARLSEK